MRKHVAPALTTRGGAPTASTDPAALDALSGRHLLPLDGIRGLAVLIVIVHNAEWIAGESQQFVMKLTGAISASGWLGVQLFFVLSGFLITGILLDTRTKPGYFRSFYKRRALRIFPLYYAVLALIFFVGPILAWSPTWVEAVRRDQWFYWLYVANWSDPFGRGIPGLQHFWSLAVEEQFYFVWPLIVLVTRRRQLKALCAVLIVVTPFIRLGLRLSGLPVEAAYTFTVARWDALAAGALVACLIRDASGRDLLMRWRAPVAWLTGTILVVLVAVLHGFHQNDLIVQIVGQTLCAVLSAVLICYAVDNGSTAPRRLQAALSWSRLRTVGKYSYAMYILHFPIHHLLEPVLGDMVRGADTPWRLLRLAVYVGVVFVLTLLAAMASWRLIEKPFLDLKETVAPRPA